MDPTQYVAFLRAVNVGGRTVKMAALKAVVEETGLDAVSTFIASGNVLFQTRRAQGTLEPQLEKALRKAFGFEVPTMVRSAGELAALARYEAFPTQSSPTRTLMVGFLKTRPSPAAVKKALALQTEADALHVVGREVFWLAGSRISDSTISMAAVEKALETSATFRNINTVRRLVDKHSA